MSKKKPGPEKTFADRLTISLRKGQRVRLKKIASTSERSLAYLGREAIDQFLKKRLSEAEQP